MENYNIGQTQSADPAAFDVEMALWCNLPQRVRAFWRKDFSRKGYVTKFNAISKTAKWLEYNKFTVNFLVVDIDERPAPIDEMLHYVEKCGLPEPTWICATDKGYQVAYQLTTPFQTTAKRDKKAQKLARLVLREMISRLGGDPHAARLNGIFRNPAAHRHIYTGKTYNLRSLDRREIEEKIDIKKSRRNGAYQRIEASARHLAWKIWDGANIRLKKGQRNAVMWYLAMIFARSSDESVYTYLKKQNTDLGAYLDDEEIEQIAKSVTRYRMERKIRVCRPDSEREGLYGDWTNEQKADYMRYYRRERGLTQMSRTEAALNAAAKNAERAKAKVKEAITGLLADTYRTKTTGKWNASKIAEATGLSRPTVAKYLKELAENG